MSPSLRASPARRAARFGRPRPSRSQGWQPSVVVEILVCGSSDRGDDGAPAAAAPLIRKHLPPDVRLKVVGLLDIDDLLAVAPAAGVVIVDAAVGIAPGQIVTLPLTGWIGRDGLRPRSSHALAFPEVIGLAELIRGLPLPGQIVAIGANRFDLGQPLGRRVAAALPALVEATLDAVERVRLAIGQTRS